MEIIGDDKRLRALYSETRFVDEQVASSFSATWHRAQSRAAQPRRAFNLAFASALALVIFAVATFAIWSTYSQPKETYSAFATTAARDIGSPPSKVTQTSGPTVGNYSGPPIRLRRNNLAIQQRRLTIAQNRRVEREAKQIASWQSPTASLLSSSSDDLFKSLPQLNQNANEMKSFLPNRNNDQEN